MAAGKKSPVPIPAAIPRARPDSPSGIEDARLDFPALAPDTHGNARIYFTNARTSQKPRAVLDAIVDYYRQQNALGSAQLRSRHAAEAYDAAREEVRSFLNAADVGEITLVHGTTEAIGLVAETYGRAHIGAGDEVVVSALEHRANLVPWKILCEERGAQMRVLPMNDDGELQVEQFAALLSPRTRIAVLAHVSNALGTVNPIKKLTELAHQAGVPVLVDGAQAAPHLSVDLRALGCDFYVFSGHKVYGPAGTGVLYRKLSTQERELGVEREDVTAGFQPTGMEIAAAVGLAAALRYVTALGMEAIAAHEGELLRHAVVGLTAIPGVRLVGNPRERAGLVSFLVDGIDANEVANLLEGEGVAIHAGHHRAEPVMERFGITNTARVSFSLFNTREEVDALIARLRHLVSGQTRA